LIECDYYLLGCSAIEDQLQDKVLRSIIEENLLKMNSDSKEKYALLVVTEDIELIMSDQELTNKVLIIVTKFSFMSYL